VFLVVIFYLFIQFCGVVEVVIVHKPIWPNLDINKIRKEKI
jgi:hypothetical protein